uniref:Uncharacterized protein n=1 Tax=Cyanothece sp. (strain PCC 7425 / ATCC 29141) TaxID=395961 RepID=B8HLG5_CYAP4
MFKKNSWTMDFRRLAIALLVKGIEQLKRLQC